MTFLLKSGVRLSQLIVVSGLLGVVISIYLLLGRHADLPYDSTNPVIYLNDWTNDYVDWYLMALASTEDIDYRGIITSSSVAPFNRHMPARSLDGQVRRRSQIVSIARRSGLRNIPDPVPGSRSHLAEPKSGHIEDTQILDSPGTQLIIREASRASPEQPLVILVGGPLTTVADAILIDEAIADNIVVAVTDNRSEGLIGYNGWADGWAAYIVLRKTRVVLFPAFPDKTFPRLTKKWIRENLSDGELRDFLISVRLDVVNDDDGDADGMPAVSLMQPTYVKATKRASIGSWKTRDNHRMPLLIDDPDGPIIVVTKSSGRVASNEYMRALSNMSVRPGTGD